MIILNILYYIAFKYTYINNLIFKIIYSFFISHLIKKLIKKIKVTYQIL